MCIHNRDCNPTLETEMRLCAAVLVLLIFAARADETAPIRLGNYSGGETIRYTVPLIRGTLADAEETVVTLLNTTSTRETREMKGIAYKGQFKVLAELLPGENKLVLKAGKHEFPFTLNYKAQTNPYYVRCIYLTDNTCATEYQTPLENDAQDYASKLDTCLKTMQCFTAERMNDLGFGRATFNLELDDNGKVKVYVYKCPAPAETYYKMNDQAWYSNINSRLEKQYPTKFAKNFVVAAYTRFDPATQKVMAHTALGGGGQALFGSGDMFTWPRKLSDVQNAFMDTTAIDPKKVFSDSVGRHAFWAAASTTIGACLHELGHTFGLPHSREPADIMTRGIDQFNRVFTFVDAISATNKQPIAFGTKGIACFPPISAAALAPCRWFALDEKPWDDKDRVAVHLDESGANIVVESEKPIRYVGFSVKGEAVLHAVPPAEQVLRALVPLADVRKKTKSDEFEIRVINDQGVIKNIPSAGLFAGPFVQTWQIAPETQPWTNTSAFIALSDEKRKEIENAAASAKPYTSPDAQIDYLALFPPDKQNNVAAYAMRIIQSDKARQVKLFTGSDDALRVWLNGKVVKEVLAMRGTKIDSDIFSIDLHPGENRLLVEVSNGGGGWGFVLRLEDADGKKLRLSDDGKLSEATPPAK